MCARRHGTARPLALATGSSLAGEDNGALRPLPLRVTELARCPTRGLSWRVVSGDALALRLCCLQDAALAHFARPLTNGLERRRRPKAGDRVWQVLVLRVAALLLNPAILVSMASVESRFFHGGIFCAPVHLLPERTRRDACSEHSVGRTIYSAVHGVNPTHLVFGSMARLARRSGFCASTSRALRWLAISPGHCTHSI